MQIHNHANNANQTLFALNRWGGGAGGNFDLGIGNQGSGHPDWTFSESANQYTIKTLEVFVDGQQTTSTPEPFTTLSLIAVGGIALGTSKKKKVKEES